MSDTPKKPRKKRAKRHSLTTWIESVDFPIVRPRPKHLNHFGLSGGKDSTALAIWAVHESGYPRDSLDFSFCDTGNECQATYDYIDYLEQTLQISITRIKPQRDFWELAQWKKRFPSAKARFCTYFLKIEPTMHYVNALFAQGHTLTMHSGVRAAESDDRAKLSERDFDGTFLAEVYRPLLRKLIAEIWEMHERYGVKPNPLYALGMTRVGCFPCVMNRKAEIARIADHFPEAIDNIRQKENESGTWRNGQYSSFFAAKTCPKRWHSRVYVRGKDGKKFTTATIDDIVAWSRTGRGEKIDVRRGQTEMDFAYERLPKTEDAGLCSSRAGHCE